MSLRLRLAGVMLWLFLPCSAEQQLSSFRSEVNLVNVTAVVHSGAGNLLPNLHKEDFEVTEDGIPQDIKFFAREVQLPLSLGLIVDVSGSQDKFLKDHERDIEVFLKTVLGPADESFAVCFGNHLRLVHDSTSSGEDILESLRAFERGGRKFPEVGPPEDRELGTALFDAIFFSMREKMKTAGGRRHALLIFSDGEENSSEHDLLDAIEEAENTDTLIYCIRYTQKQHGKFTPRNRYGMRVMNHLASFSGASDFDGLASNLRDVFAQIGDELRAMYQIGYVSSNKNEHDGTFRKIVVRCKQPVSITRAKSGYYAR